VTRIIVVVVITISKIITAHTSTPHRFRNIFYVCSLPCRTDTMPSSFNGIWK